MDRVPLQQVEEVEEKVYEDKRENLLQSKGIDTMMDLNDMSTMFGFTHGFEGENESAETIYSWAKEKTGLNGGPDVVAYIKNTIKMMGITDKGKSLLTKLRMFATLDSRERTIRKQKENLYA